MVLPHELIAQFAKATKDASETKRENSFYGTIVVSDDNTYVRIDGSDILTPISTTTNVKNGDRVRGLVENHTLIITGNLSSPSATNGEVTELDGKITSVEGLVADKATIGQLNAVTGRITNLESDNVTIHGVLSANEADISELKAENVNITGTLTAVDAEIGTLQADNLEIRDTLTAVEADIHDLDTEKLSASEADIKYANIDFTNIGKAAMEYFYANSGLIRDVTVGDQTITGHLVGVTISGDLIEGNTIVAEKLVIKGDDGLYYKLNTDGMTTEKEQTEYNSLNGSVIKAKSITASKISVTDLVAFGATIGGFKITDSAIYSGVKESVHNTTAGVYLDKTGQMAIGDSNNYIKFYEEDGIFKMDISAQRLVFGAKQQSVEDVLSEVQSDVNSLRDEITTLLRIESSRGTVFKNNAVSTVLSAVIYHGTQRITDSATMKNVFGTGAYLQWKWQRLDEDTFGIISASDTRFGDNGFTFTLSPEDMDTKVTFMCELIV